MLLVVLTVVLQPITDVRDCRNYRASGNASAFPNEIWDLYYPVLLLFWLWVVIVEQLLPVTWNGRRTILVVARAFLAVLACLAASCGVGIKILGLCH
ncbi:hypothetical protein ACFY36_03150 [Actinoplanes sp. NPDC000266]